MKSSDVIRKLYEDDENNFYYLLVYHGKGYPDLELLVDMINGNLDDNVEIMEQDIVDFCNELNFNFEDIDSKFTIYCDEELTYPHYYDIDIDELKTKYKYYAELNNDIDSSLEQAYFFYNEEPLFIDKLELESINSIQNFDF